MNKSKLMVCCILFFSAVAVSGCSAYHLANVGHGVDSQGMVQPLYAMTRNHTVIPEYVIDEFGNFPDSPEEAEKRFNARRQDLESYVTQKYRIPHDFPYQFQRGFFGIGFILISPVAVPVQCLGEWLSNQPHKRTTGKVVSDYFDSGFNPPLYDKPEIRETIDIFY